MSQMPPLDQLITAQNSRQGALDLFGVYFLRDINDIEAERFAKSMLVMATALKGHPGRRITIYINSGGGSVGSGFSMMEIMYKVKRDYGVPVDTVILGYAYSMGAVIAQAGDLRSMGFFSTMMLHGGTWSITGEDQRVFNDYQKLADLYKEKIGELFARRTGVQNPKWWVRYIYSGKDRFLSATECIDLGLVDQVCEFNSCYIAAPKNGGLAAN